MTKKIIWENRWKKKSKNLAKSTSLDFFARQAFQVLDGYIKPQDRRILEIGSGTGRFCLALARKYPEKEILGIDYAPESIIISRKGAKLRNLKNVHFQEADLFNLPFPDNHFDLVFENGVIEHLKNYPQAVKEMKRVVKKNGSVIVNVNNWYCFPKTFEKKILGKFYPFGYEKSFKHRELKKTFRDLDLREIEVYAYNHSNYIVRFFFFSQPVKRFVSALTLSLESGLDLVSNQRFSRRFGYMIFGKGVKR